jgi:hypothetical protein
MRERMAVIYRYEQQTASFTAHNKAAYHTAGWHLLLCRQKQTAICIAKKSVAKVPLQDDIIFQGHKTSSCPVTAVNSLARIRIKFLPDV